MACDPSTIGPGFRTYPEFIEFQFTSEERAIYDDRYATLSKEDFAVSVVLGEGAEPVVASAHLRGQGSLRNCARKSYTLNLTGPRRHLMPDSYTEEFYLIAMCLDDRYIQQFTANQLMQEYGYFPMKFRYVELILDGQTLGVYLLLEKTKEEIVIDNTRVRSVLRRGSFRDPVLDLFEVKHSDFGDEAAITAVRAIRAPAEYLSGDALVAALRDRFDFDGYLDFLALMSSYQNGDYIDEVWFYSTDAVKSDGSVGDYFKFTGWDNDDIFSACHGWGLNAIVDPWGLLYCSESHLAKAMFAEPYIYGLFVDKLEERLALLTEERFNQAVDYTASQLLPFFQRPEICAAMTNLLASNPGATDPVVATADIQGRLDALKTSYQARRNLLLSRIATYRAAQGGN
jgi:hypothetical protein